MRKLVYNLEFPSFCAALTVAGYRFTRTEDYPDRLLRLQHLGSYHSEFNVPANTGGHAITAYVDTPKAEPEAAVQSQRTDDAALQQILLLLSLFTGRDVFVIEETERDADNAVITADARQYAWGGVLACSVSYKMQPIDPEPYGYNIGFEETLEQVYALTKEEAWQRKYSSGYFLLLARAAFRLQPLESTFSQCWTIWEHLFTVLNRSWLSDAQTRRVSSAEKIAFLLVEYALRGEIDDASRQRIQSLAEIRNRLVHFGRFPERGSVHDDAVLFIRLTELIVAKALGLSPSNVFNTVERLEEFLQEKSGRRNRPCGP